MVTAVRTVKKPFPLTTAAQNIHVFLRESSLHKKHFFEWLETAISSNACGMSTLKSLLPQAFAVSNVHPRPRKRLARCTLDCGFKTPESPALRGFVGERAPIRGTSLYLAFFFVLEKAAKIAGNAVMPTFPMHRSHGLQHLRHKRPTFAFTSKSGYTLGFRRKIAHNGSHAETGAFRMGALSLPSVRSARSRTSPGRVSERQTLPLWDLGREVLSKNAESLRDSDALMRVAVPRRRGPAGLRDLFATW